MALWLVCLFKDWHLRETEAALNIFSVPSPIYCAWADSCPLTRTFLGGRDQMFVPSAWLGPCAVWVLRELRTKKREGSGMAV